MSVVACTENYCLGLADDSYPHESDCAWYYECEGSETTLLKCPDGLLFNLSLRDCVLPDDINIDYRCAQCTAYDPANEWGC